MSLPANIEKSAFKTHSYVGYSGFHVWRIVKTNSSSGRWCATLAANHGYDMATHVHAHNLADLGAKLKQWGDDYEIARKRHIAERNAAIEKAKRNG